MEQFYPNECIICKIRKPLRRCRNCNMVSYCGPVHEKEHRKRHNKFCETVTFLKIIKGGSHLFNSLREEDLSTWNTERKTILRMVEHLMERPCRPNERQVFLFPRHCYVCHDTRQEKLINCPGCPNASFCKIHPSSPQHDIDCSTINYIHKLDQESVVRSSKEILSIIELAVENIRFNESSGFPTSMQELKTHLDECIKPGVIVPEYLKLYASEHMTNALTVLNGLRKLNYPSVSKLTIHVGGADLTDECSKSWELLLHLLPDLMTLKVLIFENLEVLKLEKKLCNECCSRKKKLIVESKLESRVYIKYMKERDYEEPDILVLFNPQHPERNKEYLEDWNMIMDHWKELNCPIVLTAVSERTKNFVTKSLRSSIWSSLIIYDGKNDFQSLRPWREWANGSYGYLNQFIIVTKGRGSQDCQEKVKEKEIPLVAVKLSKSQRRRAIKKEKKEQEKNRLESITETVTDNLETQPETSDKIQVKEIVAKNFTSKKEPISGMEEIVRKNMILKEQNRLLKENFNLKKENEALEIENQQLEKENEKLEKEIKKIRLQVRESVTIK